MTRRACWSLAGLALACGTTEIARPPAEITEEGRAVFVSTTLGGATNPFACATCHTVADPSSSRIFPGGDLRGATLRPTFWGGAERDLLGAVNACRAHMMDAPRPWTGDEREARVLHAYLAALPGPATAVPFHLSFRAPPRASADRSRGSDLFARACASCHGAGGPPIAAFVPRLPGDFRARHEGTDPWSAFYGRVRSGGFDARGESMPPFSTEVLSDDDVAAIALSLDL